MTTKKKTKKKKVVTTKATARKLENQEQALQYRIAGLSFSKIAAQMGVSKTQAYNYVTDALRDSSSRISTNADDLRDLELERLDKLQVSLWPEANRGNPQAVEKLLKVMEMRQRLTGVQKPVTINNEILNSDEDGERKLTVTVTYV